MSVAELSLLMVHPVTQQVSNRYCRRHRRLPGIADRSKLLTADARLGSVAELADPPPVRDHPCDSATVRDVANELPGMTPQDRLVSSYIGS
jgi:hypothetical protein